ncbi:MAG: hypothetical protein DIJKHBIC_00025 [Thermoanaerobaculia bacterium]|nr:hypothetical protein [Thermoanaerobaculia bacterium]
MAEIVAPIDVQMAAAVARHVELKDVFFSSLTARLSGERIVTSSGVRIVVSPAPQCTFRFVEESRTLEVHVALTAGLISSAEPEGAAPLLQFECEIILIYDFRAATLPPDEPGRNFFQAFANLNGKLNAWPYFREFVQSSSARMGLSPVVVPVFRVPRPAQAPSPEPKPRRRRRPAPTAQ